MRQFLAQVNVKPGELNVPQVGLDSGRIDIVLQLVFGIAGGIAMIVLVLAGLKYVLSRGDPAAVAKSKNTIIYAVIGLVTTIAAYSIVTFVVKST